MPVLRDFPVISITISFVSGALFYKLWGGSIALLWYILLPAVAGSFSLFEWGKKSWYDASILILFFIIGGLCWKADDFSAEKNLLAHLQGKNVYVYGYVADDPGITKNFTRFVLQPAEVHSRGKRYYFRKMPIEVYFWHKYCVQYASEVFCKGRIEKSRSRKPVFYAQKLEVKKQSVGNPLKFFAFKMRNLAAGEFFKYFSYKEAAFLSALFLGKREYLDYYDYLPFQKTGTMHVLSISGLHTAVFIGVFNFILIFFGMRRRLRYAVIFFLLVFWIFFSGFRVPVIRASILAVCFFISTFLERRTHLLNNIFLSALVILIFSPRQLFSISFQLSYVCVIAIALAVQFLERVPVSKNFVAESILISSVLFLAVSPIISYYFGIVSFISIVANLLLVPLSMGILSLCFLFFVPLGFVKVAVKNLISLGILLFGNINNVLGNLPFSYIHFKIPLPALLLYYGLLSITVWYVLQAVRRKSFSRHTIPSL